MAVELKGDIISTAAYLKLAAAYPNFNHYIGGPEAQYQYPCFVVFTQSIKEKFQIFRTVSRTYMLRIIYLAGENHDRLYKEYESIGGTVISLLSSLLLKDNKPVYCDSINYEIVEDSLQITATYTLRGTREKEIIDKMAELDIENKMNSLAENRR